MGVDFGGANAFMTQHALDGTQVGSAFQQVGGEGMAEGMWANGFLEPDVVGKLFDDVENHDAGDVRAPFADEYKVFISLFDGYAVAVNEIVFQFVNSSL